MGGGVLEESIEKNYFSLKFWPTIDVITNKTIHQVMSFIIADKEDKKFYYGDFIASAITLGLVGKMYVVVLKDLLTTKHAEFSGSICSIRLSHLPYASNIILSKKIKYHLTALELYYRSCGYASKNLPCI